MIKLIATDLDGTLLNGDRRLPQGIFDAVMKLRANGVLFAPASGRQYANVKKLFSPVADDLLFICENGALVKYREQTVYLNPVPDADAVQSARSPAFTPCCAARKTPISKTTKNHFIRVRPHLTTTV